MLPRFIEGTACNKKWPVLKLSNVDQTHVVVLASTKKEDEVILRTKKQPSSELKNDTATAYVQLD